MASAPASVLTCSPEAREELVAIISRAFGIADGYLELNGAITAAAGFDMFDRIGMEGSPMRLIVAKLATEAESEGAALACIKALFVAYPGSFELRGWIATYLPELLSLISVAAFEAARPVYEKDRQVRRVGIIADNLATMGPALQLDSAQLAVSQEMVGKLDDLEAFKSVHDFLHGLQGTVLFELERIASPTIIPDDRRDHISRQLDDLKRAAMAIRTLRFKFARLTREPELCDNIEENLQAVSGVLTAADQGEPLTPRRGFMKLRAMLRAQMVLSDGQMVRASQAIPFTELAQILRDLAEPEQGPSVPATRRDALLTTAEALDNTSRRLALRRDVHQLWQHMDAILHAIEEVLWGAGRLDDLLIHWEDVGKLISQLHDIDPMELVDVIGLAQPIDLAAADGFSAMSDGLKRDFTRFIAKVRGRFRIADEALKQDCQDLRRLQKPLKVLLESHQ